METALATETAIERRARLRRENNEARIAREAYRADKQHLRPRANARLPRWVGATLHRAHRTTYTGAWRALERCIRDECAPGWFIDHVMVSVGGRLVFEPYMTLEMARAVAAAYAGSHGLQFAVSPIAWHNDRCVRVEFYV